MKSKYGLSRHAGSAKRLSPVSGAATGGPCSPWRRCRVEAQSSTNCFDQRRLRRERPLGIGHVIIDHPTDGARHFADFVGDRDLDHAALPWSHISGQRLAAVLDRPRDVVGERLHVEGGLWAARGGCIGTSGSEAAQWPLAGEGRAAANGLRGRGCRLDLAYATPFSLAALRRWWLSLRSRRRDWRNGRGRNLGTPARRLAAQRFSRATFCDRWRVRRRAVVAWRRCRRILLAAVLAGLDLPRALGWLGILAITSVSCGVPGGRLSPVLVIIGQYLSAKPTPLFGQKDVLHELCRTRRTPRLDDRIGWAPRPCRALRLRLGRLCATAGQHLKTGVQGLWIRHRRWAAG